MGKPKVTSNDGSEAAFQAHASFSGLSRWGHMRPVVGTAGWSISRSDAPDFPEVGTALERYSQVFSGVEVNSSFYRPHRVSTWAKWAASVPDEFRFAVKIPKTITHQNKLVDVDALVAQFASEVGALGKKLSIILVQLPPKLVFDPATAESFFTLLRASINAQVACEPRNASWFDESVDNILERLQVARVAADPALGKRAAVPGGWQGLCYWRLHGSPAMYRSSYSADAIRAYARKIRTARDAGIDAWCMFDNTAASAATGNAFSLKTEI